MSQMKAGMLAEQEVAQQKRFEWRVLKHAISFFPPEDYGLIRNAQVLRRQESNYGEALGMALKSMVVAGEHYSWVTGTVMVPESWWDHLRHDLLKALKIEAPVYDYDDLTNEDRDAGKEGELVSPRWRAALWRWLRPEYRVISTHEDHVHVCPHIDADYRTNPKPHFDFLEKKE